MAGTFTTSAPPGRTSRYISVRAARSSRSSRQYRTSKDVATSKLLSGNGARATVARAIRRCPAAARVGDAGRSQIEAEVLTVGSEHRQVRARTRAAVEEPRMAHAVDGVRQERFDESPKAAIPEVRALSLVGCLEQLVHVAKILARSD